MTEPLSQKRRRQANEAERNGDLVTAWAFREDADALDAEDDRIAELERKHQEKVQAIGKLEDDEQAAERRGEAAEAKCERLRKQAARDHQAFRSIRYHADNGHQDRPVNVRLGIISQKANERIDTALTADQHGERENGMADVSWERQLERTRDDVWNAALDQAAQTLRGQQYRDGPYRHWPDIQFGVRSDDELLVKFADKAADAIRSLKRGTP